jgi:hypothetical protein
MERLLRDGTLNENPHKMTPILKQPSFKRELFTTLISAFVVVVSAMDMIGDKARLVHIVAIVAGGIGTGIALGRVAE